MEGTIEKVGDWAVKALPALLEISKKGGRFEIRDLDSLRPSFRAGTPFPSLPFHSLFFVWNGFVDALPAVMEAREVWEKKVEPPGFCEFVVAREQSGEDLQLHKDGWTKNTNSTICQLCATPFGLTIRRHHCRSLP